MRKIEDIYKDYNEKIKPSERLDKRVFDKTIYKESYNPFLKKSLVTISILLIVSITTIGIVFAKEIKEVIQKYFITTITPHTDNENIKVYDKKFLEVHAFKELNFDADLPEVDLNDKYNQFEPKPKIMLSELEQKLQIKLLHFKPNENPEMVILGLERTDGKIGKSDFQTLNSTNNITIQIQFVTKYSKDFQNGFSIQLLRNLHGKTIYLKEYSEKIKTDIYYAINPVNTKIEYTDDNISYSQAVFVYDDVAYQLSGDRISKNMLSEFIESVSFEGDN